MTKKSAFSLSILFLTVSIVGCNGTQENLTKEEVISKIESEQDLTVTSIENEDNSRYEVEVAKNDKKKTLEIDAQSGKVKNEKNERDFLDDKAIDFLHKDQFTVTVKQAKEIALAEVPGGTLTELEKETDDGMYYYSVEIMKEMIKYSIDIDSKTGTIIATENENILYDN